MSFVALVFGLCVAAVRSHSEYYPDLLRRVQETRDIPRKFDTRFLNPIGTNAEAYWSFDDKRITFQAQIAPYNVTHPCDLIYNMNADGSDVKLVSKPEGRDTCSYLYPGDNNRMLFSSTRGGGSYCPAPPDQAFGYVWPLNKDMDIYHKDLITGNIKPLTAANTDYNAETTIAPNGQRAVFTSDRTGDLELWTMNLDGTGLERMTYTPGYDGGAYFSYSSKRLTWRASRPAIGLPLAGYIDLLNLGVIEPIGLQLYYMDLEGPRAKVPIQVTNFTGVNFSPFFLPDDSGLIFSSNMHDPMGGTFHLFTVNLDGTNLQQITTEGTFNSFPMFSFNKVDGYYQLLWCSDRGVPPSQYGHINIWKANWLGPGHQGLQNVQLIKEL